MVELCNGTSKDYRERCRGLMLILEVDNNGNRLGNVFDDKLDRTKQ